MEQKITELENRLAQLEQRRIYQQDIIPNAVKQRHIDGYIIFRGDSTDRPSTGTTEIQAYYAEDQKKLYIWNTVNSAWESSTFT